MLSSEKQKQQASRLLEEIYETDYKTLVNYAYKALYGGGRGDNGCAEDIVQEACAIALGKPEQFFNAPNPMGWLIVTIRYTARNAIKRDMHIAKCLQDAQTYCDGISTDAYSLELLFKGIVEPSELAILIKVYVHHYSYKEMEEELGMKPSKFAMRLKRIKEKFIKNYFLLREKTEDTTHSKIGGFQNAKS